MREKWDNIELERLYDWITADSLKPAITAFTEGELRYVAREIEYSIITTRKEADNFAISFAVWALHSPDAERYKAAGISAYELLQKYKSRPFIETDPSKQ